MVAEKVLAATRRLQQGPWRLAQVVSGLPRSWSACGPGVVGTVALQFDCLFSERDKPPRLSTVTALRRQVLGHGDGFLLVQFSVLARVRVAANADEVDCAGIGRDDLVLHLVFT